MAVFFFEVIFRDAVVNIEDEKLTCLEKCLNWFLFCVWLLHTQVWVSTDMGIFFSQMCFICTMNPVVVTTQSLKGFYCCEWIKSQICGSSVLRKVWSCNVLIGRSTNFWAWCICFSQLWLACGMKDCCIECWFLCATGFLQECVEEYLSFKRKNQLLNILFAWTCLARIVFLFHVSDTCIEVVCLRHDPRVEWFLYFNYIFLLVIHVLDEQEWFLKTGRK